MADCRPLTDAELKAAPKQICIPYNGGAAYALGGASKANFLGAVGLGVLLGYKVLGGVGALGAGAGLSYLLLLRGGFSLQSPGGANTCDNCFPAPL